MCNLGTGPDCTVQVGDRPHFARCRFGTVLEMQKFLPNKNEPSYWEGP